MPDFEEAHKEIHKMAEQMGIKGIGAYALVGPYDMMFIYEAQAGSARGNKDCRGQQLPRRVKHLASHLKHKEGSQAIIKAVFFDWIGTIN